MKVRRKKVSTLIKRMEWLILILFAITCVIPVLYTFANSFMSKKELTERYNKIFAVDEYGIHEYIKEPISVALVPSEFSVQQFANILLGESGYLRQFWCSVIYVVPISVFQIVVAAFAAYGICRITGKLKNFIMLGYILIILLPYQVTLFPNYLVMENFGLLNTKWAIWLPGIFSPFSIYFMERHMSRISKEVIEAARLDGAGEMGIFMHICLPYCKSVIYSCFILIFLDNWNMIEQPLWLLENSELQPLSVFLSHTDQDNLNTVFAAAVIYMILPLLIFLYGEDELEKGLR